MGKEGKKKFDLSSVVVDFAQFKSKPQQNESNESKTQASDNASQTTLSQVSRDFNSEAWTALPESERTIALTSDQRRSAVLLSSILQKSFEACFEENAWEGGSSSSDSESEDDGIPLRIFSDRPNPPEIIPTKIQKQKVEENSSSESDSELSDCMSRMLRSAAVSYGGKVQSGEGSEERWVSGEKNHEEINKFKTNTVDSTKAKEGEEKQKKKKKKHERQVEEMKRKREKHVTESSEDERKGIKKTKKRKQKRDKSHSSEEEDRESREKKKRKKEQNHSVEERRKKKKRKKDREV